METEHIIINIGRQFGSGGRIIAKMLAQDFGYKFYDRELLNLAAQESGFCKRFFEQNDEKKFFTRSFFNYHLPLIGESNFYNNISQESLFQFQSNAIRKAASESSCVFVGRCADYILRDMKNIVNIFITADLQERIERICQRHQCDEERAKVLIKETEGNRTAYYDYYTGKKWGDSSSYDLCINSSFLGIEETSAFLARFIRKRFKIGGDETKA